MQHNVSYTFLFAGAVCVVCAVLVSSSAVTLKQRQVANAKFDKQKNVLMAAGLIAPGEEPSRAEVEQMLENVRPLVVELGSGRVVDDVDPLTYDQQAAKNDPSLSSAAPPNNAGIKRVPNYAIVYHVLDERGNVEMVVIPIEGYGLWSTLYGFLALERDGRTIRGITYYQHGETPGLGGEVDNPQWKALWEGRKAYEEGAWEPAIRVIKGQAGPPEEAPHSVDGLSGATITSRGVSAMLQFWLGEHGFAAYLKSFSEAPLS